MAREWQPYEGEEGNEQAIARRERSLPPHLQMFGNKRLLRDALLAVKLLGMPRPEDKSPLVAMERNRLAQNQKAVMRHKAKLLQHFMSPETIAECEAAAKELADIHVRKQIAKQARNYRSPKKKRGTVSEAEFIYTVKQRNIRERKEWNL